MYNIFLESQNSFHKGRFTSTLVNFLEDVYSTLDNKKRVCNII